MSDLIIYGCGGHARSVAEVALANGKTALVFVDVQARPGESIFGFPVVASSPDESCDAIVAIGDNHRREAVFVRLPQQFCKNLIAQDAYLARDVSIEPGCFVAHGAYLGPGVKIGANSIVNTHSIIEHESTIGAHCHIAIKATVAGRCKLGDFVTLGAGVTVIDNISICANVFVGAGATVVDDIVTPGLYVGVPARKIKHLGSK